MSCGNTVCLTARLTSQEQTHPTILYRISIVLLVSIFTVGMVAHAQFRSQIASPEHCTVFPFRLYTARMINTLVGTQHQCFADIVFLPGYNVKIVLVGFRVSKHGINRPTLSLGYTGPYFIKFVPVTEEVVVI